QQEYEKEEEEEEILSDSYTRDNNIEVVNESNNSASNMDENKMSTIKIHLSDIASNNIQQIIRDRVFKTNKVILEGIYLFHIYLLHIISSDIHMEIVSRTVRRCMFCLLTGA